MLREDQLMQEELRWDHEIRRETRIASSGGFFRHVRVPFTTSRIPTYFQISYWAVTCL